MATSSRSSETSWSLEPPSAGALTKGQLLPPRGLTSASSPHRYSSNEASPDVVDALALGPPPGGIGAGIGVVAEPGHHHGMQGAVELAVTRAVQPMPGDLPRGRRDRVGAGQGSERGLRAQPAAHRRPDRDHPAVSTSGLIGVCYQQVSAGRHLAGQVVTVRLHPSALQVYFAGQLIRTVPRRSTKEVVQLRAHRPHQPKRPKTNKGDVNHHPEPNPENINRN